MSQLTKEELKVRNGILKMYQAAFAAICHCGNNPAGAFSCGCDDTKKTQEAISLIVRVKNEILRNLNLDK